MSTSIPDAALVHDLPAWLGHHGRAHAEVMARWRTSCPRLSVWEDALALWLVRTVRPGGAAPERVVLTAEGRRFAAAPRA